MVVIEEVSRETLNERLESLQNIVNPKPYTKEEIETIKQMKREQHK